MERSHTGHKDWGPLVVEPATPLAAPVSPQPVTTWRRGSSGRDQCEWHERPINCVHMIWIIIVVLAMILPIEALRNALVTAFGSITNNLNAIP